MNIFARLVYYKLNGISCKRKMDSNTIDSLLNMRQKENFFIGKYKFNITSKLDIEKYFIKGNTDSWNKKSYNVLIEGSNNE